MVSGGTSPYTYAWSNGLPPTNMQMNLCAGMYSVTITDAMMVQGIYSYPINPPAPMLITESITDATQAMCDGSINLMVSGGLVPYTYSWSNMMTSNYISGLCMGSYEVTVVDANGCQNFNTYTVNEQAAGCTISPNEMITPITATCDGSIQLYPTGGMSPYSYNWSDMQTTSDIYGLCSGWYYVTITDANMCQQFFSYEIMPSGAGGCLTVNPYIYDATTAMCNGGIELMVSGGMYPYSFNWSNGDTTSYPQNLCMGEYFVTITDSDTCEVYLSYTVNEQTAGCIIYGNEMITPLTATCDASIQLYPTGGMSPYTYNWSDMQTTSAIYGLCSGWYYATITDANMCQQYFSYEIMPSGASGCMTVNPYIYDATTAMCNGGIELMVTGGIYPYSYNWSNGDTTNYPQNLCAGEYFVTITDSDTCEMYLSYTVNEQTAGCIIYSNEMITPLTATCDASIQLYPTGGMSPYTFNWSDMQTTSDIYGLCSGWYYVTITDANMCQQYFSYEIMPSGAGGCLTINPNLYDATTAMCNGGIELMVSGGVYPYSFNWSNGDTTSYPQNLCMGEYFVTITDSDTCEMYLSYWVNEQAGGCNIYPNEVVNNVTASCDGSIQLYPTGGVEPYTYNWSNAMSTSSISGLCEGWYYYTITDSIGCSFYSSGIWVGNNCILSSYANATNVSMPGNCDGMAEVTVQMGNPPYTYYWDNGSTSPMISGLCEGSYNYTVTDSLGCTNMNYAWIGNNCNVYANANQTNVSVPGNCDGTAEILVQTGVAPYTYYWDNSSTAQMQTGLCEGYYYFTVTDSLGCPYSSNVWIGNNCNLSSYATQNNVSMPGNCDGSAEIIVSGGTYPYSYLWNNGITTAVSTGLCEGSYNYTVTDSLGCTNNYSVWIGNNCNVYAYNNQTNVSTPGNCDGAAEILVQTGVAPYTYYWDNSSTAQMQTGLCEGYYYFTVTDSIGCTYSSNVWIGNNCSMYVSFATTNASAPGNCDGGVIATVEFGNDPYSFVWSNGATTSTLSNLCKGNYDLTVTDSIGCTVMNSTFIDDGCGYFNVYGEPMPVSASGMCDGSIYASVSGGNYPITYSWDNGMTTEMIDSLCEGSYSLTVTDALGCTAFNTYSISAGGCNLMGYPSITDATQGNCDGSIYMMVSGGMYPYTYYWNNGATTQNLMNLCSGYYEVTVTDMNACSQVFGYSVNEQTAGGCITVMPNYFDATQGQCNGGIDLMVNGGVPPYSITWSNGMTSGYVTGLCVGEYWVTITDSDTCQLVTSYWVKDALECYMYVEPSIVSTTFGNCDGSITLTPYNFMPPVMYNWNGMTTTNATLDNLCAGTYEVIAIDYNGCSYTGIYSVMEEGCNIALATNIMPVTYANGNNGAIELMAFGGTSPYTFNWSNGATVPNIYDLASGDYSVTVYDVAGCTSMGYYWVDYMVTDTICNVYASFYTDITGNNVQFNNTSAGSFTNSFWNLGNGLYSEDVNPFVSYPVAGFYDVCLTLIDSTTGCQANFCQGIEVGTIGAEDCFADYSFFVDHATKTAYFADSSRGAVDGWYWEFGDGTYSNEQNPIHVFTSEGFYTVCLTSFNSTGCQSSICMDVVVGSVNNTCQADYGFYVNPALNTVYFNNQSLGNVTEYYWEFGDGTYAMEANPMHQYAEAGFYSVCLFTYDQTTGCNSQICKEIQVGDITTVDICQAGYNYSVNQTSKTVAFADQSIANNTLDYYWQFGDGEYSGDQNPTHTYVNAGFYDVCLSIYNTVTGCQAVFCQGIQVGDMTTEIICDADFSYFINTTTNTVTFDDASIASDSLVYNWNFGDGNFSELTNPVHVYTAAGFYDVCLSIYNSVNGCQDEICQGIQIGDITTEATCNAEFTYYVNVAALQVSFSEQVVGNVTNFYWTFGDGTTSSLANPVKTYTAAGLYTVSLTTMDAVSGCTDNQTVDIQVGVAGCQANFSTYVSTATNTAIFTNTSLGYNQKYFWSFGDGTTSMVKSPIHVYGGAGMYTVSLVVIDTLGGCVNEIVKPLQVGTITCDAGFTTFVDSTTNIAHFNNQSLGTSSQLYWEFGDGSCSTENDPFHHYTVAGLYRVSLNTFNDVNGCMDYHEEFVLIGSLGNDCQADFIFNSDSYTNTGFFYDNSQAGSVDAYLWNFGDGIVSQDANPVHQYVTGGFKNICLTIFDGACRSTFCDHIQMGDDDSYCLANYMYSVDSAALEVSFVDNSQGESTQWFWDFGDGEASTDQNPVHIYAAPGYYPVYLMINNPLTGCYSSYLDLVNVAEDGGMQGIFGYVVDTTVSRANEYSVDFVGAAFGEPSMIEWDFGDGSVDTTTMSPSHSYDAPGEYEVCLTVSDPVTGQEDTYCEWITVTDTVVYSSIISLDGLGLTNYPNPFSISTSISYSIPYDSEVTISLYDVLGKQVSIVEQGNREKGAYNFVLDREELRPGIYYLNMTTENDKVVRRLIIFE